MRLREEGLTVYGFGEKKTPDAFRNACHKFVFTEILRSNVASKSRESPTETKAKKVIYDFTGAKSLLAGMSGGKTLTIYYVACKVREIYVSCCMSFLNNDTITESGLAPRVIRQSNENKKIIYLIVGVCSSAISGRNNDLKIKNIDKYCHKMKLLKLHNKSFKV